MITDMTENDGEDWLRCGDGEKKVRKIFRTLRRIVVWVERLRRGISKHRLAPCGLCISLTGRALVA